MNKVGSTKLLGNQSDFVSVSGWAMYFTWGFASLGIAGFGFSSALIFMKLKPVS